MPDDRESRSQFIAKRSTQSSKEGFQNDEQLLLDDILSEGDSFAALKTVTSGGTHFQFKFEKSWTQTDAPMNSRFQVQISSMSENFSSIPFNERRELYLKCCSKQTDDRTSSADQFSCSNLTSGERYVDSSKLTFEDDGKILTSSRKLDELDAAWSAFVQDPVVAESVANLSVGQESKNEDVAAGKLSQLNVTQENSDLATATKPVESNKHNLEVWLDSILDD